MLEQNQQCTYWKPLKVDRKGSCARKMKGLRYVPVSPELSSVDASCRAAWTRANGVWYLF